MASNCNDICFMYDIRCSFFAAGKQTKRQKNVFINACEILGILFHESLPRKFLRYFDLKSLFWLYR